MAEGKIYAARDFGEQNREANWNKVDITVILEACLH